jgi:hypothetical protein
VFAYQQPSILAAMSQPPRYEKAHEASNIISAIKATKIISKLDLRTRRSVSAA